MIQLPTVSTPPAAPAVWPAGPPPGPPPAQLSPPAQTPAPEPTGSVAAAPTGRPAPPEKKFGLFGSKSKSKARTEQENRDLDRLRVPSRGPRRIAVVGLKGGVGKTTMSVLLAGIYSQVRGEAVLLLDADPTFGSLLLRSGVAPTYSARDLAGRGDPGGLDVLASYLAQSAHGTWILPSGLDPGESARFDQATYASTMDVVHRYFPVMVTDCGAGLSGGLMNQLLNGTHTLLFATSPSVDGLTATYAGLRYIADRGFGALVANSLVAVTAVPRRGTPVDLTAAARRFDGLCRGLLSIPDDPHLRAGVRIDHNELSEQTRGAIMHLAAEVIEAAQRA